MKSRFPIDWWLLIPVFILVGISLTTLFSVNITYFKTQLISFVIALLVFFFFARINIDFLKQIKTPIYISSLVLLSIIFVIGIESRGAIRWIDIGGVRLQFSEVLKPFLSVAFAVFLADSRFSPKKTFFLSILLLLPIVFLIYLQPDLGSALIYVFVAFFIFLVNGYPLRWFGLVFLPFVLISPLIWTMLHEYQRQRLLTFLHPAVDPLGTSYNSIQAVIAIGSGTFIGQGWFQGTQSSLRFLPERHTDFIFATLAEGIGFVGATLVIVTFAFLCYRVYLIFKNADDRFTKTLAGCCFAFFLIQGFVNIGMNVGYLPIVGVTLPFVSFGGNSLISNFIFLGILSSLSTSQKNKHVLEIK
ncbi:MAG TPA: FtsW/RodA/SpoVE family cell cycle protein [Methylomirabilota bacterium]|nr:FtsW/RodA/SpoVE family cell cycle protein [Methylomirabilota bacterium]